MARQRDKTAMEEPSSHGIGEQHSAYRRGLVLGLTMAEVGILIIFVLLLLIVFGEFLRQEQTRAMKDHRAVPMERLQSLEEGESLLREVRQTLSVEHNASAEEIRQLIRGLQEVAVTPEGQSALTEARTALNELHRVRDLIAEEGGSTALANQVEQQSFRMANQEGQLRRYEAQLQNAGLGTGERPCWVKPDGTIEYLYDVVLASDGIRMRERKYLHRARERSLLPIPEVDPDETISPGRFLRLTEPLYKQSLAANCRFFVVVYDSTASTEKERYKQLLRTVEGHFYKRLDRGPAAF